MNTLEKDLWRLIKDHLPGEVERIENLVGGGMPDVNGTDGLDYWVELKVCRTKTKKTPAELCEPLQLRWHAARATVGANVFVLIRHKDGELELWRRVEREYEKCWCGRKPFDWTEFRTSLVHATF